MYSLGARSDPQNHAIWPAGLLEGGVSGSGTRHQNLGYTACPMSAAGSKQWLHEPLRLPGATHPAAGGDSGSGPDDSHGLDLTQGGQVSLTP